MNHIDLSGLFWALIQTINDLQNLDDLENTNVFVAVKSVILPGHFYVINKEEVIPGHIIIKDLPLRVSVYSNFYVFETISDMFYGIYRILNDTTCSECLQKKLDITKSFDKLLAKRALYEITRKLEYMN